MYKTTDPKYNIANDQDGKPVLVNAASGKEIEEPIFILRAKDKHAIATLLAYMDKLPARNAHQQAVYKRFLEFSEWADHNRELVKEPDTQESEVKKAHDLASEVLTEMEETTELEKAYKVINECNKKIADMQSQLNATNASLNNIKRILGKRPSNQGFRIYTRSYRGASNPLRRIGY